MIDDVVMAHVRIAFAGSGETYGAPRVHRALRAAGLPTRTKRVARLMRAARQPAPGLIVHRDRGSHRASAAYRTALAAHGMLASRSGKGDCYEHAVAESFFATLEFELVMTHDWHTREEARRAIFR